MKHCLIAFLAYLMVFCNLPANADTNDYFFHVPTFGNEVNSIYRDATTGIVWLGTNQGLLKYGNSPTGQFPQSIYSNLLCKGIKSVQGLDDGKLLLRTISHQFIMYNPVTNEIKDDMSTCFEQWGIKDMQPWKVEIITDNNKSLWIYSENRLWNYVLKANQPAILKAKTKEKILQVYIGEEKFYILTPKTLSAFDKRTSRKLFSTEWRFSNDTRDLKILEDKLGNVWVGGENLYKYNIRKFSWEVVVSNITITEMTMTTDGNIYAATSACGIIHYDPIGDKVNNITQSPFVAGCLKTNKLHAIFADYQDNLWISYNKQNFSIANNSLKDCSIQHIKSLQMQNTDDDIIAMAYDRQGILWLGTDGNGIYNSTSSNSTNLIPVNISKGNKLGDAVTTIYSDSFGRLWVGLYRRGLLCKENNNWKVYLYGMSPYSIAENSQGDIYIGMLGDGVYKIPRKDSSKIQKIDTNGRQYIMQIFCDKADILYVATTSGLQIINTLTGKSEFLTGNRAKTQSFQDLDIQGIYKDSRGLLWLIGFHNKASISYFDLKSDSIITIDALANYNIKSIIEDDDHTIWAASDRGIINIEIAQKEPKKYDFKTYIYKHKDNEEKSYIYNYRSVAKGPDGTLFFGMTNGYRRINPLIYNNLRANFNEHKVYFASLTINKEPVKIGEPFNGHQILEQDIFATQEILLKHDENNIALSLHTQDYGVPFETSYYYQLKGLNDNWESIEGNMIELSNLSPGSYQLSVKARNIDGTMSKTLTTLHIEITAPWYQTTCAYTFYTITIILIIVLVIYYLTERQRQNMRIRQTEKEMERQHQLTEAKIKFFTNISHDLRTPLTLIITPLEAYLNDQSRNPDVKFFTPIYKNALRLLNLINQLLDFRKLEAYGTTFKPSNGDIVSFVKEVCSSFTLFAQDKHINLQFSSTEKLCYMMFDKDKLSKIMMNLLSNAFKHSPTRSDVYVKITKINQMIEISVIDNGNGVPDNEKETIFQRFYQNKSDNSTYIGCGIGLHIAKEYIKLHNGSISVADNVPKGAIFTIQLPISIMQESPEKPTIHENIEGMAEENQEANLPEIDNTTPTILLVEDNEDFLDFLENSLTNDYCIIRALNGEEALDIIESTQIDLVVSDVMMDKMDGLTLCHSIKSNVNYSHIPVILLTAKAMVEDEIEGLEVGANDYITKPFNLSVLRLRINTLLKNREELHIKFKTKMEINPSEISITPLDEQFISQAIANVEENMNNSEFTVEDLSKNLNMHRTQLYRKITAITGKTPIEFIRLIRLKRACQYLEQSQMYISEIAYAVGFNSPKLFSKYFKLEFNISPKDYAKGKKE